MKLCWWFLLLTCLVAKPAGAWNATGHAATAIIAYENLPAPVAAAFVNLLKTHPYYESHWLPQKPAAAPEGPYLFACAANWPDEIRGTDYSHPAWHFIDLPWRPPYAARVPVQAPPAENAISELRQNLHILRNRTTSPSIRAISLCWVLHLAGDLHQPLHCIDLFSPQYPHGDRGGNDIYVGTPGGPMRLHSVWDDLAGVSRVFTDEQHLARVLQQRHPERRTPGAGDLDPSDWAWESYSLGAKRAYLNGHLHGSRTAAKAPPLPVGYLKEARSISDARLAIAGYRMAGLLRDSR